MQEHDGEENVIYLPDELVWDKSTDTQLVHWSSIKCNLWSGILYKTAAIIKRRPYIQIHLWNVLKNITNVSPTVALVTSVEMVTYIQLQMSDIYFNQRHIELSCYLWAKIIYHSKSLLLAVRIFLVTELALYWNVVVRSL